MTDQTTPAEHPSEPNPVGTTGDWPSRRAGLRSELAAALEAADYSGTMRRGDLADAVLPVLYREWPWLRAEAEELGQARAELQQHAEAESADAAAGSYAGRAERVEAQLERVQKLLDTGSIGCCAHLVRTALAHDEHAIAGPERWLHVTFTSPDETTANTSALAIADHLAAEFDGVRMRITTNAVEAGPLAPAEEGDLAQSGIDTPGCDCGHHGMGVSWHGDECPWRRSVLDGGASNPAATEATSLRTRVTALYEQWVKAGPPPLGVSTARWWDRRLVELRDAIRPAAEQPVRTTAKNPAGA